MNARSRWLMVAPVVALGMALAADPAGAALIQTEQSDAAAFQLLPASPSGSLACAGGTLTGLSGTGEGLFQDGQGLFYPGPFDLSGESCIDAGGTTGELQLWITGGNAFGGDFACSLSGTSVGAGGLLLATLSGTCLIDGQPITPSSLTGAGMLPSVAGAGALTLTGAEVQPAG